MLETTYHLICDDCGVEEEFPRRTAEAIGFPSPKLHFTRVLITKVMLQGGEVIRVHIPGEGEAEHLCGECSKKVGRRA
jgi:hypothetical protein